MMDMSDISSYAREIEREKIDKMEEVRKAYDEKLNKYILDFLRNNVSIGTIFVRDYLQGYYNIFSYLGITDDGFVKMNKFIDGNTVYICTFEPKFIIDMRMEVKYEN